MKRLTIYTGIRKRSTTEILVQVRVKSAKEEEWRKWGRLKGKAQPIKGERKSFQKFLFLPLFTFPFCSSSFTSPHFFLSFTFIFLSFFILLLFTFTFTFPLSFFKFLLSSSSSSTFIFFLHFYSSSSSASFFFYYYFLFNFVLFCCHDDALWGLHWWGWSPSHRSSTEHLCGKRRTFDFPFPFPLLPIPRPIPILILSLILSRIPIPVLFLFFLYFRPFPSTFRFFFKISFL